MTNRADRAFVIGKLRDVTARARQMTGQFRRRRIVRALVAKRARKTRVFGVGMLKRGKVGVRIYHRNGRKFRLFRGVGRNNSCLILRFRTRDKKISEGKTTGRQNDKLAPAPRGHRDFRVFSLPRHISFARNSLQVRFGNRQFAERKMALHAFEARVLFPRIDFKIQNPAVVRSLRDMAHIA